MSLIGGIVCNVINKYITELDGEYKQEREGMVTQIIPDSKIESEEDTKDVLKNLDIVRNRNFKNYILLFVIAISLALIGRKISQYLGEPEFVCEEEPEEENVGNGGGGPGN